MICVHESGPCGGFFYMVDHVEHGLQHTDDRAVRAVFAFCKPAQSVKVTKQFVRAVNKMNYHTVSG
jgi:hypothetical protein